MQDVQRPNLHPLCERGPLHPLAKLETEEEGGNEYLHVHPDAAGGCRLSCCGTPIKLLWDSDFYTLAIALLGHDRQRLVLSWDRC